MKKIVGILTGVLLFFCAAAAHAQCTIGEALDAPDLTWDTGGSAAWLCQTIGAFAGDSSAQSGDITDNQTTWLQTTVTVETPKVVSFFEDICGQRRLPGVFYKRWFRRSDQRV
ncbi:MAG: hypothetical protein FJ119_13260 [Deltaproteobacteria bacterium]|nr:hypothetical protein [Deltaproteobacteria bacterium]